MAKHRLHPRLRVRDQDGRHHRPRTRAAAGAPSAPVGWRTWSEAVRVVCRRSQLRSTSRIALVIGTVLFGINHLDVVLAGDATATTWAKGAITYAVPFVVANLGALTATRAPRITSGEADDPPQG